MDLNYNLITHEQLQEYFNTRLAADPRFAKMAEASIYKTWENLFTSTAELTNFYIMRTAQECFIDTARLESSVIKWCHNLCYSPKRAIPAKANIKIRLKGPLNPKIEAGDIIWFNTTNLKLSFNNLPYVLDTSYSYTFTRDDILNGKLSTWVKEIEYSIPQKDKNNYSTLQSGVYYIKSGLSKISIFQGEIKEVEFKATDNLDQFGESYQHYDIDDIEFSNFYGSRDPFANQSSDYNPRMGITKVGIALDKDTAYNENIFDIELLSTALNYKAMKAMKSGDDYNPDNIRVVRVKTNPDKTVRLEFGEGKVSCCGMKDKNEKLYVQYLATKGSKANKTGVVDSILKFDGNIYSSGKNLVDISSNVEFIFTTNICNGADFESMDSMKMNAKLAFASGMKLISTNDYIAFLNQLTNPFNVFASTAFGENEIMNTLGNFTTSKSANQFSNTILYSVIGNLYLEDDVINIYDKATDYSNILMYNSPTDMMNHIGDYTKLFVIGAANNFDDLINSNFGGVKSENSNTLSEMHKKIYKQCEPQVEVGKTLYPVPPLVHYFDLVGNIVLNKSVQIGEFKSELEKNLYAYFAENLKFNNKIYKSAVSKKIYEYGNVVSNDIDFVVSTYIKSDSKKYKFSNYGKTLDTSMFKVENDNTLSVALVDSNSNDFDYSNIVGKPVNISTLQQLSSGKLGGSEGHITLSNTAIISKFLCNQSYATTLSNKDIDSNDATIILQYVIMNKFNADEFETALKDANSVSHHITKDKVNNILNLINKYINTNYKVTNESLGNIYGTYEEYQEKCYKDYPKLYYFANEIFGEFGINRWNSETEHYDIRDADRYWSNKTIDGKYVNGANNWCNDDCSCPHNKEFSSTLENGGVDNNVDDTGNIHNKLYEILTNSYGFDKNLNTKIQSQEEQKVFAWDGTESKPTKTTYTLYKYRSFDVWMMMGLGFSDISWGKSYEMGYESWGYYTYPQYYLVCEEVEVKYNRAYLTFRDAVPTRTLKFGDDEHLNIVVGENNHYSEIMLVTSESADIQDFGTTTGKANLIASKCPKNTKTTERAKNLPYELKAVSTVVHNETYEDVVCTESDVLFNDELTKNIKGSNTPQEWTSTNNSILNTYANIKVATTNTVLDENSNIVNYTLPSEISFIKIKLNYVPET